MTEIRKDVVRGWKAFDKDLKCRDIQFAVGKTYEHAGDVVMCSSGFHFHHNGGDIFAYYKNAVGTRICEVEAHGSIVGDDKAVCARLIVGRELNYNEICGIYGSGSGDGSGYGSGDGDGSGYYLKLSTEGRILA